jgi:DNA mismatch repair protein MSH2
LKKFPDLQRMGQKFEREKANLQDVIRVYQVVMALPEFLETLQCVSGQHQELIKSMYYYKLVEFAKGLNKLKALVETTVDLEAADHHEYIIKAEFHPELEEIRVNMNGIGSDIQKMARQTANELGLEFEKKLKYEHSSQYGHHLRLSRNVNFTNVIIRMLV